MQKHCDTISMVHIKQYEFDVKLFNCRIQSASITAWGCRIGVFKTVRGPVFQGLPLGSLVEIPIEVGMNRFHFCFRR